MMNFSKYSKNILTKILSVFALVLLTAGVTGLAADLTPSFNTKQGDIELLSGRNTTQGQTVASDPVNAKSSDEVEVVIYYHNGVADSTAVNTRIKVLMDANSISSTHVLSAQILADNAVTVSDTVVNGQIVGKSGLTINLDTASQIKFVDGSVRWFAEASQSITPLLNNQNGSELFSANGLNIGDIKGCWAHSGYLMFKVQFVKSNLVLSKSAFNNTQNIDATKVVAQPGDSFTYTLTTKNTGDADQANYVILDGIKDVLDYANVTSVSDGGVVKDQPSAAIRDDQTVVVYPAVTIAAGQTVTRTFTVSVKNPLPTTAASGYAYDHVMFNHYGNDVVIVVGQPIVNVSIVKGVRNTSTNESAFTTLNTAKPGDGLAYLITVKNIGSTTVAPILKDVLPNGVEYVKDSIVAKTNSAVVTLTGDLFGDGLNLPTLSVGQELTVEYRITTFSGLADETSLKNVAKVLFNGQELSAQAATVIVKPVVTTPTTLPRTGTSLIFTGLSVSGLALIQAIRRFLV